MEMKLIEALQEKVRALLGFVELHSLRKCQGIETQWRQMAEAAFEVEDTIDFHVVNRLHQRYQGDKPDEDLSTFCQDMERMIWKMEFMHKEISTDVDEGEDVRGGIQTRVSLPAGDALAIPSGGNNVMVGFDEHVDNILDLLTNDKDDLQIIPIVGTGGIGKTTLAEHMFDHPSVKHRFDIRVFVTISQEYSIPQILKSLLNERENGTSESVVQLGARLHKTLFGRRYLIVLDDVWSVEVWEDLKASFPNNGNGSRVMLTTRLSNLGVSVGSHTPYSINFLNETQSWNLLCQNIFARDDCPREELERIGKDIARSCRGLPLLINVIGSMLAKSNMSLDRWEFVAKNVNCFDKLEDDKHCFRLLSLSYDNLPIYLKPCFLYMRRYPEDAEIRVSELMERWVAEGFIKSEGDKSLEEIAEVHFRDLIDRNLIFVRKWTITGKIETCGIHDLLRDLCSKESTKESFTYSPRVQYVGDEYMPNTCFFCRKTSAPLDGPRNTNEFVLLLPAASQAQFSLCDACKVCSHETRNRWPRAIDVFPDEFVSPSGLRFASITLFLDLNFVHSSSLHLLWNLQTLKIRRRFFGKVIFLPPQIWEMPQLRHIDVFPCALPYPKIECIDKVNAIALKDLQTLSNILLFECRKDILEKMPNVKELNLTMSKHSPPCDFVQLHRLETLHLEYQCEIASLPNSLKKLSLCHIKFPLDDMSIIGSLPNLEELSLYSYDQSFKWNPTEGEFLKLRGLCIQRYHNVELIADQDCFPMLEWLILKELTYFEIPLEIGCMATMRSIELERCSTHVIDSARKIWEELQDMDSGSLQITFGDVCRQERVVNVANLKGPEMMGKILQWVHYVKISL